MACPTRAGPNATATQGLNTMATKPTPAKAHAIATPLYTLGQWACKAGPLTVRGQAYAATVALTATHPNGFTLCQLANAVAAATPNSLVPAGNFAQYAVTQGWVVPCAI